MTAVHTVASAKPRRSGARPAPRSAAHRQGSDALAVVMFHTHSRSLAGQRIFIRTRLELDYGTALFEQVQAVVPEPHRLARRPKKA